MTDELEIPRFLRRKREPVHSVQIPGRNEPAPPLPLAPHTDMVVLSMYLDEGGHRRFLLVSEGNRLAHLLHIPTLEYVKVSVEEVRRQVAIGRASTEPVEGTMAATLRAKAEQWDRLEKRYSRVLVNEALEKLGAAPLPAPESEEISSSDSGESNRPVLPQKGSKAELIGDLLQRPGGCTTADILAATGWPSVSVPAQAKQVGLALRKEKAPGQPTRYYGSKP